MRAQFSAVGGSHKRRCLLNLENNDKQTKKGSLRYPEGSISGQAAQSKDEDMAHRILTSEKHQKGPKTWVRDYFYEDQHRWVVDNSIPFNYEELMAEELQEIERAGDEARRVASQMDEISAHGTTIVSLEVHPVREDQGKPTPTWSKARWVQEPTSKDG